MKPSGVSRGDSNDHVRRLTRARRRPGITLTEILISLLILAVGLVSLATLFPLGLLRASRHGTLFAVNVLAQAAEADLCRPSLLSPLFS